MKTRKADMDSDRTIWRVAWMASTVIVALWVASGLLLFSDANRGTFGDMFGAINALFSGLAFAGVVVAILLQRQEMRESRREFIASAAEQRKFYKAEREANADDHRRRRLEATMSYIAAMSMYRRLDYELSGQIVELAEQQGKSADAAEMLAQIENFAAGVRLDVFDLNIVNAAKGGYLIDFYQRWFPYLQSRVDKSPYPDKLYDQLEWLVREIAILRAMDPPQRLRRPQDVAQQQHAADGAARRR